MKKTTYIIIGMLVGTVCLIFGGIALCRHWVTNEEASLLW